MRKWTTYAAASAAALAVAGAAGPASAATAPGVKYTHSTTLTQPSCAIHANYPGPGIADWGWTKQQRTAPGALYHVGVRYTNGGYAMVQDYARSGDPSWGFIATSCLADPRAYDAAGHPLPDLQGIGGNGRTKAVPTSAPHAGRSAVAEIHVGGHVGSLRSGPRSFVIGNVRPGDPFTITTAHCGHHAADAWILGYAAHSGRWGYVQAAHLPACR